MSLKEVILKKNQYHDSVYLMGIFNEIEKLKGIKQTLVMMGTDENKDMLSLSGFRVEKATANDLVIAVEGQNDDYINEAVKTVEDYLTSRKKEEADNTKSYYDCIEDAIAGNPDANLCVISTPGKYILSEASKALENGLNVFIFSDNVPAEDEIKLKKMGLKKDLLVMGPDCGVGSINAVALATGSVISEGPIGIVAASGSGAQEIACLIDKNGLGISQLIGTGGKDLSSQVGGLTMLKGMEVLDKDSRTDVIVLVSKLADMEVVKKILSGACKLTKPVVSVFLGADKSIYRQYNRIIPAYTLEEAATKAMSVVKKAKINIGLSEKVMEEMAEKEVAKYSPSQKYLRGLYMGGTFTEEALIILNDKIEAPLYSNIRSSYSTTLEDSNMDRGHILIDMGAEEYTRNKPHPVIDPGQRIKEFSRQADNENVAVILLDYILSYGVHPDPVGAMIDLIKEKKEEAQNRGRHLTVISSVCGTDKDPQNLVLQEKKLAGAGVIVMVSNTQAAKLASKIISKINS